METLTQHVVAAVGDVLRVTTKGDQIVQRGRTTLLQGRAAAFGEIYLKGKKNV